MIVLARRLHWTLTRGREGMRWGVCGVLGGGEVRGVRVSLIVAQVTCKCCSVPRIDCQMRASKAILSKYHYSSFNLG